ncbi:MAG: peptidoglycan DD-metalloendopeptidase family protein [Gammaproteobacteria bacterium]|nr:peptidoglycan DD-metalloendopeptidase family protein [Gammaproteobacteria bacterium]
MKKIYSIVAILISLIFLGTQAFAAHETKKLKQINTKIKEVKTTLIHAKVQQESAQEQLKNTEISIGNLENSLHKTQANLTKQHAILNALITNQNQLQAQLAQEQRFLADQMRSAYILGQENYFKTLLNLEDPAKISRMLVYHRYILNSRLKLVTQISEILKQLSHNKQKITEQTQVLQNLKTEQQNQHAELLQAKNQRKLLLANIKIKIKVQNEKLKKLLADKENLEKLIIRLSAIQKAYVPKRPPAQLCNKYIWPTKGNIDVHFGSSIQNSSWKWNGILISAPEDQEVHAIADGKIIFSEWLSGYGLLLIIDHGRGYMSLYGRNHTLYKKVGEEVNSGEAIATVGKSGGFDNPELYFAIRYNGKPVNPETWCKKI